MKKNYIYALSAVAVWSSMATVAKLVLEDIPNLQALALSSFIAFNTLWIVNTKSGVIKELRTYKGKDYLIICGLGFIGLFMYTALYYYGINVLGAQVACILNYLWPIMIMVFSCLILGEKMTTMKLIAMGCSFAGIVVLSFGGFDGRVDNAFLGVLACITAAVCYGLFSVLNKKADYNQSIAMMIIWFTTLVCSAILGILTEDFVAITPKGWIGLLWLGIGSDGIAYLWWALSLKGVSNTAKIANLAYLTPFLSVLISALVLKEQLQPQTFAALIFIVGGILLQQFFDKRQRA